MSEIPARHILHKIRKRSEHSEGSTSNLTRYYIFSLRSPENRRNQHRSIHSPKLKAQQQIANIHSQTLLPNSLQYPIKRKIRQKKQLMPLKVQQNEASNFSTLKETGAQFTKSISKSMKKHAFNNVLFSDVEYFYCRQFRKRSGNPQTISMFTQLLQDNNIVLKKISPIVLQTLLKLGCITRYKHGEIIYREGAPIQNVGVIVWGEAVLNKQNSKFKFSCYPGCALGEELLFQKITHTQKRSSNIEKGSFLTYENCKSLGASGVLFVGEKQYRLMSEELIKQGMKDILLKFQSVLLRSYIKKRQKRLLFG